MEDNRFLFLCYSHQREHFLQFHADELELRGATTEFLLLDQHLNASRAGFLDIPRLLIHLVCMLCRTKPSHIISITPKAGLLSSLSRVGFQCRRVHWFTGQVWCLDTGASRFYKRLPDWVTAVFASQIFCDSNCQRRYLLNNGFRLFRSKINVHRNGSICGVAEHLLTEPVRRRGPIRRVGVVGRINREKGIGWLIDIFRALRDGFPDLRLVFFGFVDKDDFRSEFESFVDLNEGVKYAGNHVDKLDIFTSFDVLLNASYREGFSNVLIEAQAVGCPVICRDIYGVHDSFVNGVTGYMFSDVEDLKRTLLPFWANGFDEVIHAECRSFVERRFKRTDVVREICNGYEVIR